MKKVIYFSIILALLVTMAPAQSVSPSGAFTYSVPIEVPPGTGGVQPNLSLNYNSQSGNGFLGMGWSLGGLSVITRDTGYDVTWNDSTDRFVYNGQKLIPDVNNPIGSDYIYYTENYNGQRIRAFWNGSFIETWEVTQQDGTRMIYGKIDANDMADSDGYIAAVGKNGAARLWALRKVIDVNGNYYLVDYREDPVGGDYYPDRIVYTCNSLNDNDSRYKAVVFGYDNSRADRGIKYIPSLVDLGELMVSVEIRIGTDEFGEYTQDGKLIRHYALEYESASGIGISQLISVQEFGSDGVNAKPKIEFDWSKEEAPLNSYTVLYTFPPPIFPASSLWLSADVNGDGFDDLLVIDPYWAEIKTSYGSATGLGEPTNSCSIGIPFSTSPMRSCQFGDFNGDGFSDLLLNLAYSGKTRLSKIFWGSRNGLNKDNFWETNRTGSSGDTFSYQWLSGDITGDGKTDFIEVEFQNSRNFRIYSYHGHEGGPVAKGVCIQENEFESDRIKFMLGDYTGDSKADLVLIYDPQSGNDSVYCYKGNVNGLSVNRIHQIGLNFPWKDSSWYNVDLNNDGFIDLIGLRGYSLGTEVNVLLGSPNGLKQSRLWKKLDFRSTEWHLGDFSGDGLTDLIGRYSIYLYGFNNNGNFLLGEYNWGKLYSTENEKIRVSGDFNGDGISELLNISQICNVDRYKPTTTFRLFDKKNTSTKAHQIITIRNNQGGKVTIDYSSALQLKNQSRIPKVSFTSAIEPSDSSYPNITDLSSRYLATKVTINNGLNNKTSTKYEFYNGKTRIGLKQDRQSLGFQYTKTTNSDGSYIIIEYYQEDRLDLTGSPKKRSTYDKNNRLYTEQQWDYYPALEKQAEYGAKSYKQVKNVRLSVVTQRNYNGDSNAIPVESVTKYNSYDDENNPLQIFQSSDYSKINTWEWTNIDYVIDKNDSCITKPKRKSISNCYFHGFQPTIREASRTLYYYDNKEHGALGLKGQLSKVEEFITLKPQVEESIITEMTYDPYGNLETTIDPKGITSSTITYDPVYHMYPVTKTNAKGQTENFQYDNYMRPAIAIGFNGAGTRNVYDGFGRVIGTYTGEDTDGDGDLNTQSLLSLIDYSDAFLETQNGLLDVSIPEPRCIVTKAYTSSNQSIHTYVYYDGLGRILQQKTKAVAPAGNIVFTTIDYYYDKHGREKFITIPYFSNIYSFDRPTLNVSVTPPVPPNPYKAVEYDSIGRVVKSINSDSTFNQNIYELNKTWYVDENGYVSMQEIDGRKILNHIYSDKYDSAIGTSGLTWAQTTITEKVRWGSQISEFDVDDSVEKIKVETTTDMLGRTLTQKDQSVGLWSYKYDANSNLIERIDARGQILSFTYDELNRLTGKYYGQIDQAHPALNQLRAAYYYDGQGSSDILVDHGYCKGLLTRVETFDNNQVMYGVSYKYDRLGRVVQISKKIAKNTDVTPVEYVTANQIIAYDRANRITQETYPGEEVVTYSYDAGGQLVSVIGNRNGEAINYGTNMTYTALGKMNSLLQGNGVTTNYGYYDETGLVDPANDNTDINLQNTYRLESINITKGSTIIANTHYEYDRLDNILKKTYQGANGDMEEFFSYDHQNRLAHAEQSKGRYNYDYAYSEDNNINNIISHESADNNSIMGDSQRFYVYNAAAGDSGRTLPHAVKEIREGSATGPILSSYTYDENGNMTTSTQYTTIEISAKAEMANVLDEEPIMMLHINGKKPIEWKITNLDDFHTYRWVGYWNGNDTIDVVYKNGDDTPDSSLVIDSITVNGTIIQAENPAVIYDKGPWIVDAPDGNDTQPGTETLDVEGALRFTTAVTAGAEPQIRQLTFDEENRLVNLIDSSNHNNFYYNEGEERIKKTDLLTSSSTYYFFDNYEETWDDGVGGVKKEAVSYYFANNLRLAQRTVDYTGTEPQDQLLYNHTDHLGSAVVLTNEQGDVVYAIAYDPYGRTYYTAGVDEANHKFTDQEKDDSGLYYYGARYYDPEIGRFISPDSVLAGLNRYAYCFNKPIKYIDPTGNTPKINGPSDFQEQAADLGMNTGGSTSTGYTGTGHVYFPTDSNGNKMSIRIQDSKDKTVISTIGMNGDETIVSVLDYKNATMAFSDAAFQFLGGIADSYIENFIGRRNALNDNFNDPFQWGQTIGDILSILHGGAEFVGGGLAVIFGGAVGGGSAILGGIIGDDTIIPAGGATLSLTIIGAGTTLSVHGLMRSSAAMSSLTNGGGSEYKSPVPGKSGKEAAKDVPSWAKGNKPFKNENGKQFANRLLDGKYGTGNWEGTGPGSEYSKIKKWGDRAFK